MGAPCRWHAKWHRAWHRAGTVPSYVEVGLASASSGPPADPQPTRCGRAWAHPWKFWCRGQIQLAIFIILYLHTATVFYHRNYYVINQKTWTFQMNATSWLCDVIQEVYWLLKNALSIDFLVWWDAGTHLTSRYLGTYPLHRHLGALLNYNFN